MKTRQFIILGGAVIFALGFFGRKYLASMKENSERKPPQPAIRSAEYIEVTNQTLRARIPVTGKLIAKDKIEIYAEVSGNLLQSSGNFKSGNRFNAGASLIRIDDSELQLSIQSQKSNFLSTLTRILPDLKLDYPDAFDAWKKYADQFSVERALPNLPAITGSEKYFLSTQGVLNQFYAIKSQEARLSKYTVSAPFAGTVSEALIKPGTLVRAGQKLGEFIKTGVFEIEAAIDLNYLKYVSVGAEVDLKSDQYESKYVGKVVRISDALDPATQSAKVIFEVVSDELKEGMYLTGAILSPPFMNAFALAKDQVNAKEQTFVIENGKLVARTIHPLFIGENEIISADLRDGEKILQSIYDGAFEGARIAIEGEAPQSDEIKPAQEQEK